MFISLNEKPKHRRKVNNTCLILKICREMHKILRGPVKVDTLLMCACPTDFDKP